MRPMTLTCALAGLVLAGSSTLAQQPAPAASAGPGLIVCKTAKACELGIGNPAKLKYQIDVEALPPPDKDRLGKQCKPEGKTPCVATVDGTEIGDPMKIKAARIKWYN